MSNFLDDDLEPELDTGIFDEEDEDAEPETTEPIVEKPVEKAKKVETSPITTLIEHEDMVVDTETGEVIDSGPEAGLPAEVPETEEVRTPAEPDLTIEEMAQEDKKPDLTEDVMTEEELDKMFGNNGNAIVVDRGSSIVEDGITIPTEMSYTTLEETLPSEPDPLPPLKTSDLDKLISMMEFKHITELDPSTIKFEDCNFGEFETEIHEAQDMVNGYYTRAFDINPVDAEYDLGRLSALMVRLSRAVGYFQGLAEMQEDTRKFSRAAIYTEMKTLKDKHSLKLSDKDADHASRTLTGKYITAKSKAVVLSKMVTNFWFAMRRFIDVLEGIIIRGRSEARLEVHAENAIRHLSPSIVQEPKIGPSSTIASPDVVQTVTTSKGPDVGF